MKKKKSHVLAGLVLATGTVGLAASAQAADPAVGQAHYESTCVACHGPKGISVAPIYPNLAGQKEQYLITVLKEYRDGTRTNPIMAPMAKGLSDTDIGNLAAYLSRIRN